MIKNKLTQPARVPIEKVIKFDSLIEMIPEAVEKLSRKQSKKEEEDGETTDELSKEE